MNDDIGKSLHSFVHFEPDQCTGCGNCVKRCPTRAIRVRQNKAVIKHSLCIGCGECIRICEDGAITASTSELHSLNGEKITIALVSPVLYSQFPGVLPKDILVALKNMGFSHAVDMSYYFEMFQWATAEYISRNRRTGESPWPLISPVCPVVLRLIVCRFPALLPHVHPIMRPVALMARDVKSQFKNHYKVEDQDIILYYINPCPSKTGFPKKGLETGESSLIQSTGAIGINDIYAELSRQIKNAENSDKIPFAQAGYEFEQCTSGGGLLWSMSGGEAEATGLEKTLAVAGLDETIRYLEKIELGLFNNIEYIEFRTCREGCIGGSLNAIDKYIAKSAALKMAKTLGVGTRLNRDRVLRLYDSNWFFPKTSPQELIKRIGGQKEKTFTFEELKQIEKIVGIIDGKSCGACGSPDCRTFAQDLLKGEVTPRDCVYLRIRGITEKEIFD